MVNVPIKYWNRALLYLLELLICYRYFVGGTPNANWNVKFCWSTHFERENRKKAFVYLFSAFASPFLFFSYLGGYWNLFLVISFFIDTLPNMWNTLNFQHHFLQIENYFYKKLVYLSCVWMDNYQIRYDVMKFLYFTKWG